MNLTKKQTEEVLSNFLVKKDGLNEVLQMMLNSMMHCERKEFLIESEGNKGNGYRQSNVFGYGHQIGLRVPRDRQSEFMPTILALFREQETYLKEVFFDTFKKLEDKIRKIEIRNWRVNKPLRSFAFASCGRLKKGKFIFATIIFFVLLPLQSTRFS